MTDKKVGGYTQDEWEARLEATRTAVNEVMTGLDPRCRWTITGIVPELGFLTLGNVGSEAAVYMQVQAAAKMLGPQEPDIHIQKEDGVDMPTA